MTLGITNNKKLPQSDRKLLPTININIIALT